MSNPRKIILEVTVNWDDYEEVADELIIEDSGLLNGIKDGVEIIIINTNEQLK